MKRSTGRRAALFAAMTAAGVAGASAARSEDVRGTIAFADGALVPQGCIELHLEDLAVEDAAQPLVGEACVESDGKSKAISFSAPAALGVDGITGIADHREPEAFERLADREGQRAVRCRGARPDHPPYGDVLNDLDRWPRSLVVPAHDVRPAPFDRRRHGDWIAVAAGTARPERPVLVTISASCRRRRLSRETIAHPVSLPARPGSGEGPPLGRGIGVCCEPGPPPGRDVQPGLRPRAASAHAAPRRGARGIRGRVRWLGWAADDRGRVVLDDTPQRRRGEGATRRRLVPPRAADAGPPISRKAAARRLDDLRRARSPRPADGDSVRLFAKAGSCGS